MILQKSKADRLLKAWLLFILVLTPFLVQASTYYIWGRAYSARPLFEGETMPENPLKGIAPGNLTGESNMVATVERNLVKVTIVRAGNNNILGSAVTLSNGSYFIYFTVTDTAPIPVRCLVHEAVTEKLLLESAVFRLLPYPPDFNIRYIAIPESSTEISDIRNYPDYVLPENTYTGIFTRVGKIELANDGTRLISTSTGLATVPETTAQNLYIPGYSNSPFGGNLYLFGAFSRDLYDMPVYYRIRIDNLEPGGASAYMTAPLRKTRYTINTSTMSVDSVSVLLGPKTIAGVPNCYELTPLAAGNSEFYSFPDLLALWPTGGLNGRHRISIEVSGLPAGKSFQSIGDYTDLLLNLDNSSPIARFNPIAADTVSTPRVYTPGSAPAAIDLVSGYLGSFPGNYGGTGDYRCMIFDMPGAVGSEYLAFNLTAYHSNSYAGYIRYWFLQYIRNDNVSEYLIGKQYDAASAPALVDYASGVRISSTTTAESGFSNKYLYLPKNYLVPASSGALCSCAYRFRLVIATRTTDGYHYIRWNEADDYHFIRLCP